MSKRSPMTLKWAVELLLASGNDPEQFLDRDLRRAAQAVWAPMMRVKWLKRQVRCKYYLTKRHEELRNDKLQDDSPDGSRHAPSA